MEIKIGDIARDKIANLLAKKQEIDSIIQETCAIILDSAGKFKEGMSFELSKDLSSIIIPDEEKQKEIKK